MMFHVKPSQEHHCADRPLSRVSIEHALDKIGVPLTTDQAKALARHAAMVLEANREFNLTSISEPADFEMLHVVDSATAVVAVARSPVGQIADLGSGAGYPGVVVAILTGRPTVLVESVKKKAKFLSRVANELDVGLSVYAERAEALPHERGGGFACVTARALAALPCLVELAAPLLIDGGLLVAMKGRPSDDELASGRRAARLCGMKEVEILSVRLSATHLRTLVIYERVGRATIELPRRIGLAQRAPLA